MSSIPRRSLLAVAAVLLMPFAATSSASAATYVVDGCQRPDGTPVGTDGWVPSMRGSFVYYGNSCAADGALTADFDAGLEHNVEDFSAWTILAPTGTRIAGFSASRSSQAGPDRPYGSPAAVFKNEVGFIEECSVYRGCSAIAGDLTRNVDGTSTLYFGVECGGGPGGRCSAGVTRIAVKKLRLTLSDERAPTLSAGPTGTLTSASARGRTRSLAYSAADEGGGVYRQRLLVDGTEVASGSVDDNSGKCVRYPVGGGYGHRVPCKLAASGTMSLDTGSLSDGEHDVALEVYDATAANKVTAGPWTITVDNAAPTVGDVTVNGEAREGETLSCFAPVSGQDPSVSYQWLRASPDGSSPKDIAGATSSTYKLSAADVGRKVLCEVTATDRGGTTRRASTITSGPFTGGALVVRSEVTGQGAAVAAAAVPSCSTARAVMTGASTRLLRSYGRSRVAMAGKLVGTAGEAQARRSLGIVQTVVRAGAVQRKTVATVSTSSDGRFRVVVPRGPSRTLQLVDPGCGSVGPLVAQRVRGALQAKAVTARVRNGQTARISGRLLGGYVGRGVPLELQVKIGSQWRDVKHATTNSRGQFKVGYRFTRTYVRYTYRFRMVTRAGGAWPYLRATSRTVQVRVN